MNRIRRKEDRGNRVRLVLVVSLLAVLLTGIGATRTEAVAEKESTAVIDLALLLQENKVAFYQHPDLALGMLAATLPDVTPGEETEIRQQIREFIKWGFENEQIGQGRFLFAPRNNTLGAEFLDVIRNTEFRLTSQFIKEVYERYESAPGRYAFEAFLAPAWAEFSKPLANEDTYSVLSRLLTAQGRDQRQVRFLNILYHTYMSHPRFEEQSDDTARQYLLQSLTRPTDAENLYKNLQADHWQRLSQKHRWLLSAVAYRVYDGFTPEAWSNIPHPIVLDMARKLEDAGDGPDREPTAFSDWLTKLGKGIQKQPEAAGMRSLLCHFIEQGPMSRRASYQLLRPLFKDDQEMFIGLHHSPPEKSPMALWHVVDNNWSDSRGLLKAFFDIEKADRWTPELWTCLLEHYYKERGWGIQHGLYTDIMEPILKADDLKGNKVRESFLQEVHKKESEINEAHRYEAAHYFITNMKMSDTVYDGTDVLSFALDTMVDLDPTSNFLYKSPVLGNKIGAIPSADADRIVAYINQVLDEPLQPLCYALMGKEEKTRGVSFDLLQPDGTETVQAGLLDKLLRRIVQLKNRLQEDYGRSLEQIEVLVRIEPDIVQAMQDAIEAKDKPQIVTVVRIALKITAIVEYDQYLERILAALRKDVFGVADDPFALQRLPPDELAEKVAYFNALNSEDLVVALKAVKEGKYMDMFFQRLYVPLRSIHGFFRRVGAKPYIEFSRRLIKQGMEPSQLFEKEVDALGKIRNAPQGPAYINAENAVVALVNHYCDRTGLDLWQDPKKLELNQNVNLPVLHRLLTEKEQQFDNWRPKNTDDENLASNYTNVAEVFLNAIARKELLLKDGGKNVDPIQGKKWNYLNFLRSLTDLTEIHAAPLPNRNPTSLYDGDPAQGLEREVLEGNFDSARKVNGTLRAQVVNTFTETADWTDGQWAENYEVVTSMALLLPNRAENNDGKAGNMADYKKTKSSIFDLLEQKIEMLCKPSPGDGVSKETSAEVLQLFILLARLECSVGGLGTEEGLGYKTIRADYAGALVSNDGAALCLEEFRLLMINPQNGKPPESPIEMKPIVMDLVSALLRNYELLGRAGDPFGHVVMGFYKRTDPKSILEELRPDDVATVWFLTTKVRDALVDKDGTLKELESDEDAAARAIMSALYSIHSFFMPYVHGDFNIEAVFDEGLPYALPLFAMLDGSVKKPTVELLNRLQVEGGGAEDLCPQIKHLNMPPQHLATFLLCHNMLPLMLLETCLDDSTGKCFQRIVEGHEVKFTTYNFRVLWQREDRATVSFEHICDEVLSGIDCNKDLLLGNTRLGDGDYLEYFFGDMRKIMGGDVGIPEKMPRNFDAAVQKIAKLVNDDRLAKMTGTLTEKMQNSSKEAEQKRYKKTLDGIKKFPDKIEARITNKAFEYFGEVLAEKFQSIWTIQKACELTFEKVSEAEPDMDKRALGLYSGFYENAFLEGEKFHPLLEEKMVDLFYPKPETETGSQYKLDRQNDMISFIDGAELADVVGFEKTKGLKSTLESYATGNGPELMDDYTKSGKRFMRCLFVGKYRDSDQPFIGDLLWTKGTDKKRSARALPYDDEHDAVKALLEWIFECAQNYQETPGIRDIFVGAGDWEHTRE